MLVHLPNSFFFVAPSLWITFEMDGISFEMDGIFLMFVICSCVCFIGARLLRFCVRCFFASVIAGVTADFPVTLV